MPQNELMLRRTLAGIETVRGTAVAVTKKLYEVVELNDAREALDFAENAGSRYGARRTHALGPTSVSGTAAGPMTYEDAPFWFEHGVEAGVAAAADGGTPAAQTRLYTPAETTDDLASSTMQTGVPDNVYRSTMVMLPQFTIRGDIDGDAAWMFDGTLFARTREPLPAGYTAGVVDRDREYVRGAGTVLTMDEDFAAIGTTPVTGRFISFSVTYDNATYAKRFMENVDAVSTRVGGGEVVVTGQIQLEFDRDDELALFRGGVPSALRIRQSGAVIHDAVTSRLTIDIPRAHWGTPTVGAREQNLVVTLPFRAYQDDDAGWPISFEVVNDRAAL